MKNVEEVVSKQPVFQVRLQGAPPPQGWTVRYQSGAEEVPEYQPGNVLAQWSVDNEGVTFSFSPDPHDLVTFDHEAEVVTVVEWLRKNAGIESETLKVG